MVQSQNSHRGRTVCFLFAGLILFPSELSANARLWSCHYIHKQALNRVKFTVWVKGLLAVGEPSLKLKAEHCLRG